MTSRLDPVWLIDLDDTLHRATPLIFERMNRSMTEYVMRHLDLAEPDANELRQHYWQRYGATLLGLMRRHGTDPRHFLHETHQFPDMHEVIDFDRAVRRWLKHLPGRKILVSNAPRHYVMQVLRAMGVLRYFDAIETIESMRFVPKPAASSLRKLLARHRVSAARAVMVEDNLDNLKTAHRLGLRTVWIAGAVSTGFAKAGSDKRPDNRDNNRANSSAGDGASNKAGGGAGNGTGNGARKSVWDDAIVNPRARAQPSHVHLRVHSVLHLLKPCRARLF